MFTAILDWLNAVAFTAFGMPTTWAEILGFITGLVCVYLVAVQNIWNWPIGIVNNLMWIVLFFTFGLYADSMLQIVFIGMAIYGWYQWVRVGGVPMERPVARTTLHEWGSMAALGVLGYLIIYTVLLDFTPSTVPVWDALIVTGSLLAVWGQAKKKVESWFIWMAVDVISIPLYQYKGLTLTALLYILFFAICVKGYLDWKRDLTAQEAQPLLGVVHPVPAEGV